MAVFEWPAAAASTMRARRASRWAVYPIVLGTGKKLFSDGFPLSRFTLVETRALKSGVLITTYRRGA